MDTDGVRRKLAGRRERLRAQVHEALDVVPGLQRLLDDLVRIQVIDRSMVIAAQGLLALVPLLIVLAAFMPESLGSWVVDRFQSVTGVTGASADSARQPLNTDRVRAQTGLVGIALTVISATSFARAVQRTYERIWDLPHRGGVAGTRRCFVWLAGWLLLLEMIGLMGSLFAFAPTLGVGVRIAAGTLLWWWTAHALLLGRVPWRRLAPGALLTGVTLLAYVAGSGLVMPRYAANSSAQLGALGLVLTVTSWLIGFGFVVVVAAVLGRVLAEEPLLPHLVDSLRALPVLRRRGRPGGGSGARRRPPR